MSGKITVNDEISDQTISFRKPHEVKSTSNEFVPTARVLRSHKRKLVQANENNTKAAEGKRKCKDLCDIPDCIFLSDSDTVNTPTDVNKLVTSTPICPKRLKNPIFDESLIKPKQDAELNDNSTEVIVISDTSASTLPVIVLSDGEESEIEVIDLKNKQTKKAIQINTNKEHGKKRVSGSNKKKLKSPQISNLAHVGLKGLALNRTKIGKNKGKKKAGGKSVRKKSKACHVCKVGENIYVDQPVVLPKTGLRPIIIDGSNVAFHHSNNSYFSCRGLEICIKYFKNRGHEVIAFVPQYRVQYKESDNPKLLDLLVKSGDVVLTPSRMVNGNRIVPYDDRFIVQTAVIKGGIIVTRDNYRDLLVENPSWAETIQYRLLQFTWVQDLLMFPNDPLGKKGPSLDEFLRFR